ncbi:MAG: hypothetical protein VB958_13755 [Thalassolituus sp.]|uniref:hypothetical protein n=1 Tax=Thalassolituus sp. TaxID=2030822 RepID=UPI0039826CF2
MTQIYASAALLLLCMNTANSDTDSNRVYGSVEAHEPMFLGYTWDEDDVAYMDFKLSMRYPILHRSVPGLAVAGFLPYPYFSFTGRFGQYIGTRESSPVLSKRFNPELFGRYWLKGRQGFSKSDSVDIVYGHESNGQSVTDENSYLAMAVELAIQGDDPRYADDYISRGWDYLGMRHTKLWDDSVTTFTEIKYLLDHGLIQKDSEGYNLWEDDPEGKPRREVYGLSFAYKKNIETGSNWLLNEKIFLKFTTGIENTFAYNTVLTEISFTVGNLPLMLWASYGYNSDLADYYKRYTSGGIALEFMIL